MLSLSRHDIQTDVAFLTTCVKQPDEYDCSKLVRVINYLKGTRGLKLTLCVHGLYILKWWVDDSYAVHEEFKGHTGYMMSLGKCAITIFQENNIYKARSPQRMRLLVHIIHCHKRFVPSISLKHRDKPWYRTSYINTKKALSY